MDILCLFQLEFQFTFFYNLVLLQKIPYCECFAHFGGFPEPQTRITNKTKLTTTKLIKKK